MNENEQNSENKSFIRKNWQSIFVMLTWVINSLLGGYFMIDGNYKEASTHFLSANMFAMMYVTFFTKFNNLI